MIIGTAGHIDHGKTALVKALTGVDTDRLPEEKARGITLDLGFAYANTRSGDASVGFVDVPGHENLVHTMLAGAAGINFVLLVVAADDGVMPQTREHLQIVDLLGLAEGAIALTKIDRVADERVAQVIEQVRALTRDTALAQAPIFPVSNLSLDGIDDLRNYLDTAARLPRQRADQKKFRLSIDRTFTLAGAGVIVTGTVYTGTAKIDDALLLSPAGTEVRVRSIHALNRSASQARAGERCGINIVAGRLNKEDIARGDWLLDPALHLPTTRVDARLRLLASAPALPHWSRVHVHAAAAHTMAHIVPLETNVLAPDSPALAQLVFDRAIGVLNGDRLILRDASARHTIGSATVLDCLAPARHRKRPQRLALLNAAADAPCASARLVAMAQHAPLGVDLDDYCARWNVTADQLDLSAASLHGAGSSAFSRTAWADLATRTQQILATHHAAHPDELGLENTRLRRMLSAALSTGAYQALVAELLQQRLIAKSGPWLHLADHIVELLPAERALAERVLPLLLESAFDPPWVRDIAQSLRIAEAQVRTMLLRLARRGEVFQITHDLFYHADAVAKLALQAQASEKRDGAVRAAAFRDAANIGRKRAIQILEFFDRVGYTRRTGDEHRLRGGAMFVADEHATNP